MSIQVLKSSDSTGGGPGNRPDTRLSISAASLRCAWAPSLSRSIRLRSSSHSSVSQQLVNRTGGASTTSMPRSRRCAAVLSRRAEWVCIQVPRMAAASPWSPSTIASRIVSTSRSCGARLASRNPLMRSLRMRVDRLRASSLRPSRLASASIITARLCPSDSRVKISFAARTSPSRGPVCIMALPFPRPRGRVAADAAARRALSRLAPVAVSFASLRADGGSRVSRSGFVAVDVIRSGVLWSRLESRAPAFDARRLGPARGGLGDAPAAARTSRCRLRSARARINFTHVVELVCRIVARPHAGAASMAAAFGVDPGAPPEMPTRLSVGLATPIPALPSGTSRRMPDPEDLRDLWWRRRGVRIRQPVGGPGESASVAARVRRRVRAEPRRHGAVARSWQRRPAWRLCAATAHGPRRRRPGLRREGG